MTTIRIKRALDKEVWYSEAIGNKFKVWEDNSYPDFWIVALNIMYISGKLYTSTFAVFKDDAVVIKK